MNISGLSLIKLVRTQDNRSRKVNCQLIWRWRINQAHKKIRGIYVNPHERKSSFIQHIGKIYLPVFNFGRNINVVDFYRLAKKIEAATIRKRMIRTQELGFLGIVQWFIGKYLKKIAKKMERNDYPNSSVSRISALSIQTIR